MAAITTPPNPQRTIVLKCSSLGDKYHEGRVQAGKTITPGMLVERATTGTKPDGDYRPHSTAGGPAERIVAQELAFIADVPGLTFSGGTIDDNYAAGDLVRMHQCQPGDECYMLLGAGATAVIEVDFLESAGTGYLRKASGTNTRLFKPLEAVDNSTGANPARIRVRAI
jgi:hypothetical protein